MTIRILPLVLVSNNRFRFINEDLTLFRLNKYLFGFRKDEEYEDARGRNGDQGQRHDTGTYIPLL